MQYPGFTNPIPAAVLPDLAGCFACNALNPATRPPSLHYVTTPSGNTLVLAGDWTLDHFNELSRQLTAQKASRGASPDAIDFSGLDTIDTAGGQLLHDWLGKRLDVILSATPNGLSPERLALLNAVIQAAELSSNTDVAVRRPDPAREILGRIGAALETTWKQVRDLLGFMGVTFEALARTMFRPSTWRVTAVFAQLEQTAFNAVPIIALLTFMVGAVVAFLGATILTGFGASIYTINLVTFSFLREFAVLLTAILMAGRTASAFTAQLGAMKGNEEIDALRMTGLDPVVLLVLPRIIALLIALPLLTFIGMVCGILGGMLVCAMSLDISPTMFMSIFQRDIQIRHFVLGMVKAPIFAYLIAIIGCLEGFKVKGSAQSLGEHTTSAVVQSIFIVILVDAVAAMFFMEMGW